MFQLAMRHVRQRTGQWCAVALVEAGVSVLMTLSLGLVIAGARAGGDTGANIASVAGVQLAFVMLTGVACIAVMTRMVVGMCRREIAQWQLAGVTPLRSAVLVLCIVLACGVLACSAGALVGAGVWPLFGSLVMSSGLPPLEALHRPIVAAAPWAGLGAALLTAALAGLFTLRATLRIEPVELVRLHPMRATRMGAGSRVLLGVWLALAAAAYGGVSQISAQGTPEAIESSMSAYWGCGLLLLLAVLAGAPVVFRMTFAAVTFVVPASRGTATFTARANVACRGAYTSAMAVPLLLGSSTVGLIEGMAAQATDAGVLLGAGEVHVSPWRQLAVVFGAPVLITVLTGVGTVFATSRQRSLDGDRLRALGMSDAASAGALMVELVIHALGTSIVCYATLATNSIVFAQMLRHGPLPGAHIVWPGMLPAVIIGAGCLVSLTCAGALLALRQMLRARSGRRLLPV